MSRPRLLDLFCGAGGCSVGYARAGFEVVGVDCVAQPNYPFEFHRGDALEYLAAHGSEFDASHASPPCQSYCTMTNRRPSHKPKLIADARELLEQAGGPYVIENVPGAKAEMVGPVIITGEMFGLGTTRPRLFETNWLLMVPTRPRRKATSLAIYGPPNGRWLWQRKDGSRLHAWRSVEDGRKAMGIDWMEWSELREAIPPAYTEFVGRQLLAQLEAR